MSCSTGKTPVVIRSLFGSAPRMPNQAALCCRRAGAARERIGSPRGRGNCAGREGEAICDKAKSYRT